MNEVSKFIINNEEIEVKDAGARASISNLSEVARTGEYNDLLNKPTIPPAITIDSELSSASENPVQNKVITSNINVINDDINVIGPYTNMLKPTLNTQVQNGVTCTSNGDGTYTLNGTASANAYFYLINKEDELWYGKKVKLVGCPSGGSKDKYYMSISDRVVGSVNDFGNGGIYTLVGNGIRVMVTIISGTTVSDLVFKPMVTENLSARFDDFVKFTGSTGKLNSDVAELQKNTNGLKFNVNGTNLEITDGTHTWTVSS